MEVLDTTRAEAHWKAHGLESPADLAQAGAARRHGAAQRHSSRSRNSGGAGPGVDQICRPALETGEAIRASVAIRNVDRTVGTILGHEVTKATRGEGLPDGTIDITFEGSAGQSFGAFLPAGITLRLEGDANDYLGWAFWWPHCGAAGAYGSIRRGRQHHRRQCDRIRRDVR